MLTLVRSILPKRQAQTSRTPKLKKVLGASRFRYIFVIRDKANLNHLGEHRVLFCRYCDWPDVPSLYIGRCQPTGDSPFGWHCKNRGNFDWGLFCWANNCRGALGSNYFDLCDVVSGDGFDSFGVSGEVAKRHTRCEVMDGPVRRQLPNQLLETACS